MKQFCKRNNLQIGRQQYRNLIPDSIALPLDKRADIVNFDACIVDSEVICISQMKIELTNIQDIISYHSLLIKQFIKSYRYSTGRVEQVADHEVEQFSSNYTLEAFV